MGTEQEGTVEVAGISAWRVAQDGAVQETNTRDRIALTPDGCDWRVQATTGAAAESVEIDSRQVSYFVGRVVQAKRRLAYKSRVRPPVPKPAAPKPKLPPHAKVACPLCRGEAWPDCEACAGEGWVTRGRADRWTEQAGDHDD